MKFIAHCFRFTAPCLLFILTLQSVAQTDTTSIDSLEENSFLDISNAKVEFFTGRHINRFQPVDTSLDLFQKYNPARRQGFDDAYLGNLGAPYYSRLFEFNRYLGFDYGRHERDLYLSDIDELNYYRTNIPFTDLSYVLGTNSEQYFRINHTRNVGPDFNFSIGLDKIASTGYYQHCMNDYVNVYATAWYKSKNDLYEVYAGGIHTENKNDENGGIGNDTLFDLPFPNLAEPFRTYAFTEWKSSQGQVTQQLNLGKHVSYQVNDSTQANYFAPEIYIRHSFGAHNYDYKFEDLFDTLFYSFLYDDSDTLRDMSDVDGFYNRLSVGNSNLKFIAKDSTIANPYNWEIYALQQYHEVSDQGGTSIFRNSIAGASFHAFTFADSLIQIAAEAAYDLNTNDYEGKASILVQNDFAEPEIGFTIGKYEPSRVQDHYYGFRFRWENEFKNIDYKKIYFNLHSPFLKTDLDISISDFKNYIYFDDFIPVQSNPDIRVIQVELRKNFVLEDFHLNNLLAYQAISSTLNYPAYLAAVSWYYQKHLFHSALFTQIGFDAWYCADYEGHAYNMITGQFNEASTFVNDSLKFNPVIDVFANFDIRTFRFFLKVDNVAQGLFDKGYYESPYYPMQPRGVKFGVNWMLFY